MGTKDVESRRQFLDHVLVLRCQAGDSDAFARLYSAHEARLRGYVSQLVSAVEVDDVLQEVWVTAYRKIGHVTNPGGIRAWLLRIARTIALDTMRRAKRRAAVLQSAAQEMPRSQLQEPRIDEAGVGLREAMTRLSVEHREVLQLRFLEDLPYGEIAVVVGCPVGTVRSRLHHAKAALRALLGGRGIADPGDPDT